MNILRMGKRTKHAAFYEARCLAELQGCHPCKHLHDEQCCNARQCKCSRWCSCKGQLERRTSVVYSAKASALALITVSITHSMPALERITQQAHGRLPLHMAAANSMPRLAARNALLEAWPLNLDAGDISESAPKHDAQGTPAGEQLQQLHEEAAQAAPLGGNLDLQLPAVQHRALACSAAATGWSHKHRSSLVAHGTCCFVTSNYNFARTLHLIAEVRIRQLLLCPVVDLDR